MSGEKKTSVKASSDRKRLGDDVIEVVASLPHCKALNITADSINGLKLTLKLPYSESIVGNPENGVIHGGALTSLMDTACGFASILSLGEFAICPTIDLRIDYMTAATPGLTVYGEAEAYRVTKNIIFARGVAFHKGQIDRPIAHCVSTFIRMKSPR